jgi:hypothetical protein
MPQEGVAQPRAAVAAFDQPGDVGDDEASVAGVSSAMPELRF